MWRVLGILLLAVVAAMLWLSYDFAATYHMFRLSLVPPVLHDAAAIATGIVVVVVVAQLLLRLWFPRLLRAEPTSLQRGLVFIVLSFAAAAIVLAHLGFDLTTILTTSAIVTAIVGLSIQPTLGSVLSGLQIDRIVRVGDGILLDGQPIEITSLNWRSVAGRRPDGATVILPNSQLAGATLAILPRDRSALAQIAIKVPANVPPDILHSLVNAIVDDFPEVDARRPVALQPDPTDARKSVAGYRAFFWVRHYAQRSSAEAEVLSRVWYALRREGLVAWGDPPPADDATLLLKVTAALRIVAPGADRAADEVLRSAEIFRYGDGERIVLPRRAAIDDGSCLLLDGGIARLARAHDAPMHTRLSRKASLAEIERTLAWHIGPYAEIAVGRAAADHATLTEICDRVATEIDDPGDRAAFLRETDTPRQTILRPGFLFRPAGGEGRDTAQLRAFGHALILVAPNGVLTAGGHPQPENRGAA